MLIRILYVLLLFQENLMTKSLKKWLFSERTKSRKVLFLCIFATVTSYCWVSWSGFVIHSYSFLVYFTAHIWFIWHITEATTRRILKLSTYPTELEILFIIDLFWYVTWRINKRKYWWINLWSNWNNKR